MRTIDWRLVACTFLLFGCSNASHDTTTSGAGGATGSTGSKTTSATGSGGDSSTTSGNQGGSCGAIPGYDPVAAGDPSCCDDGNAHCVPTSEVLPSLQYAFSSCTDKGGDSGLCVPDVQIKAGSSFQAASCPSIGDAAGVCLSKCVHAVNSDPNVDLLNQSNCAGSDELCAPCINPLTSQSTHACDKASCEGTGSGGSGGAPPAVCPYTGPPIVDPATFDACAPACAGAHCVPAALVPAAQQSQLAKCTAKGGDGYCTPDPFIASGGNGNPKTCNAFTGADAEGRCLSKCLLLVIAEQSELHQDVCEADELCVPCTDPVKGTATGACTTTSCDMPAKPSYTFPTCCPQDGKDAATCVPKDIIPTAQQSNLQALTCPTNFLCVPNEYLPGGPGHATPETCSTLALVPGACISQCTTAPTLPQSGCSDGHECVPCALAPAGTPGCNN